MGDTIPINAAKLAVLMVQFPGETDEQYNERFKSHHGIKKGPKKECFVIAHEAIENLVSVVDTKLDTIEHSDDDVVDEQAVTIYAVKDYYFKKCGTIPPYVTSTIKYGVEHGLGLSGQFGLMRAVDIAAEKWVGHHQQTLRQARRFKTTIDNFLSGRTWVRKNELSSVA